MRHMKAVDTSPRIMKSARLSHLLDIQGPLYRLSFAVVVVVSPPPAPHTISTLSPLSQNILSLHRTTRFAPACQLTQQHGISHRLKSLPQRKRGTSQPHSIAKEAVVLFFSYVFVLFCCSVCTQFREFWHCYLTRENKEVEIRRFPAESPLRLNINRSEGGSLRIKLTCK